MYSQANYAALAKNIGIYEKYFDDSDSDDDVDSKLTDKGKTNSSEKNADSIKDQTDENSKKDKTKNNNEAENDQDSIDSDNNNNIRKTEDTVESKEKEKNKKNQTGDTKDSADYKTNESTWIKYMVKTLGLTKGDLPNSSDNEEVFLRCTVLPKYGFDQLKDKTPDEIKALLISEYTQRTRDQIERDIKGLVGEYGINYATGTPDLTQYSIYRYYDFDLSDIESAIDAVMAEYSYEDLKVNINKNDIEHKILVKLGAAWDPDPDMPYQTYDKDAEEKKMRAEGHSTKYIELFMLSIQQANPPLSLEQCRKIAAEGSVEEEAAYQKKKDKDNTFREQEKKKADFYEKWAPIFVDLQRKQIHLIAGDGSEYEKFTNIFSYVSSFPYINGYWVCLDYSELLESMCQEVGINCVTMHDGNHMWNTVRIDGQLYGSDATWGRDYMLMDRDQYLNNHGGYTVGYEGIALNKPVYYSQDDGEVNFDSKFESPDFVEPDIDKLFEYYYPEQWKEWHDAGYKLPPILPSPSSASRSYIYGGFQIDSISFDVLDSNGNVKQ